MVHSIQGPDHFDKFSKTSTCTSADNVAEHGVTDDTKDEHQNVHTYWGCSRIRKKSRYQAVSHNLKFIFYNNGEPYMNSVESSISALGSVSLPRPRSRGTVVRIQHIISHFLW